MTGVTKKETLEISELLAGDLTGETVRVNGAVHAIRDMGEVAFVILRKREGLLQCVYEEGKTNFDLKDLKGTGRCIKRRPCSERDRDPVIGDSCIV